MAGGKGCKCGAYGECECGCDVDWTPQEIYDLRKVVAENAKTISALKAEIEQKRVGWTNEVHGLMKEIERLRLQLAACGVAAMQNTEQTVKDRLVKSHPCWTASYGDVCDAVDREIKLRERVKELESVIAGMREVVLEYQITPPDKIFMYSPDVSQGDPYAVSPRSVTGMFKTLDERWRSPEVKIWSEEFRYSRDKSILLESRVKMLESAIKGIIANCSCTEENMNICANCTRGDKALSAGQGE